MTSRKVRGAAVYFLTLLVLGLVSLAGACGATYERAARGKLADDGYSEVTLRPLERGNNAFSFIGTRDGQTCEGEIEIQEQLGQTTAAVSSRCGVDRAAATDESGDGGGQPDDGVE